MAKKIGRVYKKFDQSSFLKALLTDAFFQMELKERINAIAATLRNFLPEDFVKTITIFKKVAPTLGEFENWALLKYIELYGIDNFDESIKAMKELTQFSTAEFAIRLFMIRYTKQMLSLMNQWVNDPNEHVRRLAAEGSRPRGVWTEHIISFKKNPRPVLQLLEKLKGDPSLYVRKAVANNLNDISKDHPDLVIKLCKRWKKDNNKHTDWIIKHACRTLLKKGDLRVLSVLGFTLSPRIKIYNFTTSSKKVKINSGYTFSFSIKSLSKKKQKLAIDYKIHYVSKNGKKSLKVFKLAEKEIPAGNTLALVKKHHFKDNTSRKHYTGMHHLELIINGIKYKSINFNIII